MPHYRMSRKIAAEGAGLYKDTSSGANVLVLFKSGEPMTSDFSGELHLVFDPELPVTFLPTFFESPAWVVTSAFYQDLKAFGLQTVEMFPAWIRNEETGAVNRDYVFLNITRKFPGLNRSQSEPRFLGEGMQVVDHVILDASRMRSVQEDLFVLEEDTDVMIISDRLYEYLKKRPYSDILFDALIEK